MSDLNVTNPVLSTRVTPQERDDFDKKARKQGMERGDYLAFLVRQAVYGTRYATKYVRVLQKLNRMTRADFISMMAQHQMPPPQFKNGNEPIRRVRQLRRKG